MSNPVNQNETEFAQLNRVLEERVKRRTAQLEAANAELQREVAERKRAEQALTAQRQELQDYIDSLKKAESAVAERTAALELANAELEAFSYSVSHDLRAPLRAIEGFATALEEDAAPQLDDQARSYLTRIRNGIGRMNQLIEGLLNLSRVSRREINRAHFSLSALAREVVAELKESAPDRQVTSVIQPELNTFADRQLLRIVLGNLIGNSWKFTAKTKNARIEFGEKTYAGHPAFFIRDNGAGFEMEYKDKLFKVFQRLHSVDEYEGTGIGLATVHRIIRRHGGRAWAEGEPGKGATFYFTLPNGEYSI